MFKKSDLLSALVQLLFGILGALIVHIAFANFSPKITTVDITGIVKGFEEEIIKQKLSQDELTKKVTQFSDALNTTLVMYAKQEHLILVPKEVIIAGNIDKTNEIKELIKKRMNP